MCVKKKLQVCTCYTKDETVAFDWGIDINGARFAGLALTLGDRLLTPYASAPATEIKKPTADNGLTWFRKTATDAALVATHLAFPKTCRVRADVCWVSAKFSTLTAYASNELQTNINMKAVLDWPSSTA